MTVGPATTAAGARGGDRRAPDIVPLDFTDPRDNVYAYSKMFSRIDGKPAFGIVDGTIYRVAPDSRTEPFMGYIGLCPWTAVEAADGAYRISGRELCYYTDLKTGEVLDEWYNPWIGETTIPYHVRNREMHTLQTVRMPKLQFGDHHDSQDPLHTGAPGDDAGGDDFILDWKPFGPDRLSMTLDVILSYPNACDPERWPRESTGPMLYPSEHWTFFVSRSQLEDRSLPYADYEMVYGRVSPWAPWMLMANQPGWMYYQCTARKAYDLADVPPYLRDYVERHDPDFLFTPPYDGAQAFHMSSWESFARDREPTP